MYVYFIIGLGVGAGFAIGCISMAISKNDEFMEVVTKHFPRHQIPAVLTLAIIINVLFWPIMLVFMFRKTIE